MKDLSREGGKKIITYNGEQHELSSELVSYLTGPFADKKESEVKAEAEETGIAYDQKQAELQAEINSPEYIRSRHADAYALLGESFIFIGLLMIISWTIMFGYGMVVSIISLIMILIGIYLCYKNKDHLPDFLRNLF